jgi:hypothetical protein
MNYLFYFNLVETETEELEILELNQGISEQTFDWEINHIKEEDEKSSSDDEIEDKGTTSTSQKFSKSEPTNKLPPKKPETRIFGNNKKEEKSFDELTTKYNYSKVNVKREDKKLDDLATKYDYSRVATKRPTMLEKQYNFLNNNLKKDSESRKSFVEPKRDEKTQDAPVRKINRAGGTVMLSEKPLASNKSSSSIFTAQETSAKNKPEVEKSNKVSEFSTTRNVNRRVSMVVNPVKRDNISVNNLNKKDSSGSIQEEKSSMGERSLSKKELF